MTGERLLPAPALEHPDEARMYAALCGEAPGLAEAFVEHLPAARAHGTARLVAALRTEGWTVPAGRFAHPTELIGALSATDPGPGWAGLAAEVSDSVTNLALAMARRRHADTALRAQADTVGAADCLDLVAALRERDPAFDPVAFLERLSTGGHNLHPCARTRLGMAPADLLRHDLESTRPTRLVLVGVRRDRAECAGCDIGELLLAEFPDLGRAVAAAGLDRAGYVFLPVHEWQFREVLATRYAEQVRAGLIVPVPGAGLRAEPTMALRTLLTAPGRGGRRYFVKTALDIQVTSTRRTISVQTATNGPVFSALLDRLVAAEPALAGRVIVLPELGGATYLDDSGPSRDLSALVRGGLAERLAPGEVAVPGCALYARSPLSGRTVLAELAARHPGPPLEFLAGYARLLLGTVVRLMTKYGVGLEAHPQNVVATFVGGVPTRMALRDWGGMRVHPSRLARHGHRLHARPGSVTVTDQVPVLRAKVAYTAVRNHLAEVVAGLGDPAGWDRVAAELRAVFAELAAEGAEPADLAADEAALFAPTLPHKALVTMRLASLGGTASVAAGGGDRYVEAPNPLHGTGGPSTGGPSTGGPGTGSTGGGVGR